MSNSAYPSAIVLLSGGVDSTTLLVELLDEGVDCLAVSFNYRQTHLRELEAAELIASTYEVQHRTIDLRGVFGSSALMGDKPMPTGHYTDASMRATVVPNRNMVFLSVAASIAIQARMRCVAIAAHSDDFGTYPDCRRPFMDAIGAALAVCDYAPIGLWTPYLTYTKREIVKRGLALGIDYSKTWSCYTGGVEPCGVCGACSARNEAFKEVA